MQQTNSARGYVLALASAAMLSTTAVFIRHLTTVYMMPSLILAMWRNIFTVVTLGLVLILTQPALLKVKREHVTYLIGYGVVLASFNALWTMSVSMNGASVATVLVYCSVAFTALLGRLLLREQLGALKLAAVVVSLIGCLFVSGAASATMWRSGSYAGLLVGVLSGLSYAGYSLLGRSAAQRGLNPWTTLLYTFTFAGIVLATSNIALAPQNIMWLGSSIKGWSVLLVLAAGPTVVGFGLYNLSLVYLPASIVNLVATLEPVFTAIVAYVFLHELLTRTEVMGSILILFAVALIRCYEGKKLVIRQEGA